jgi:O-antigen/teichoic acid export membrane protein
MVLIGRVATIGLGTVLMGELPQHEGSERPLVYSATAISAVVGAFLGAGLIVAAGLITPELRALAAPAGILLFAVGVATTSSGFVLDQALIGLLRGGLQLLRNTMASIIKLVVLVGIGWIGFAVVPPNGGSLLFTWVVGATASMAVILKVPPSSKDLGQTALWHVPHGLVGLALRHHMLNLAILAPSLLLPVLVTAVISAEANAYFYIAYTIANLGWAVPAALATALYASGARDIGALAARLRLAFWLSIATGIAFNLIMVVAAGALLSIFGAVYADQAGVVLRVLCLAIFPVTITSMYVPIARLERRFLQGTILMIFGMLVSFSFVIAGARFGGLDGAGLGWLVGASLGVLPLIPTVFRVAVRRSVTPIRQDAFGSVSQLGASPPNADVDT